MSSMGVLQVPVDLRTLSKFTYHVPPMQYGRTTLLAVAMGYSDPRLSSRKPIVTVPSKGFLHCCLQQRFPLTLIFGPNLQTFPFFYVCTGMVPSKPKFSHFYKNVAPPPARRTDLGTDRAYSMLDPCRSTTLIDAHQTHSSDIFASLHPSSL